jgi:hypothetical protein
MLALGQCGDLMVATCDQSPGSLARSVRWFATDQCRGSREGVALSSHVEEVIALRKFSMSIATYHWGIGDYVLFGVVTQPFFSPQQYTLLLGYCEHRNQ